MGVISQTLIRYFTLTFILVAGLLLILSSYRQDWMREEVTVKFKSFKNVMKQFKNMTAMFGGAIDLSVLDGIPDDAKIDFKTHFGLKKTCSIIEFSDFNYPTAIYLPKISWCVKNDVFTNPSKYKLTSETVGKISDESKALKNAFICMVLAVICVVVALVVLIIKPFKWTIPCMIATIVLSTCACICVVAALGVIHSNFNFQRDFETTQNLMKQYNTASSSAYGGDLGYGGKYSARKRRDDGSAGYGNHYSTPGPVTGYGEQEVQTSGGMSGMGQLAAMMQQEYMEVILDMKLKESIGSPLVMAGLGMGFLLLVIILTLAELYMNKKFGALEVKYEVVAF